MRYAVGASGVVMYNHIPLESSRVITPDAVHGAAMVSSADGAKVLAALAAGGATMTFSDDSPVRACLPVGASQSYWSVAVAVGYRPRFCQRYSPCGCCCNTCH